MEDLQSAKNAIRNIRNATIKRKKKKETGSNYSKEQRQEIAQSYINGMTGPECAEKHGCAKGTVYRCVREFGGKVATHSEASRQYSEKQRQDSIEMYKQGTHLSDISDKIGCCTDTVRRWLYDSGDKPRGSRYTDSEKQVMRSLYRRGIPITHISDKTGRSVSGITRYLKRIDIIRSKSDANRLSRGIYNKEEYWQVKELVEKEGHTVRSAAEKIGVPKSTATHWSIKGGFNLERSEAMKRSIEMRNEQ